jgi:hypothetical protein
MRELNPRYVTEMPAKRRTQLEIRRVPSERSEPTPGLQPPACVAKRAKLLLQRFPCDFH